MRSGRPRIGRAILPALLGSAMLWAAPAAAAPVTEPWGGGTDRADVVGAAALSGWYATGETADDTVEIRDVRRTLVRRITRDEILALAPWMTLDSGGDGPAALAWTDSGRSLFIVVADAAPSTDGLGSDVVLRYDTTTEQLTRFARAEIGDGTAGGLGAMHFRGTLWVATQAGTVRMYNAGRNDLAGSLRYAWSMPGGAIARGLDAARGLDLAFVVSDTMLYRVDLTHQFASAVAVGPVSRGTGVAYSNHYGTASLDGVFVAEAGGAGVDARVLWVPWFQAAGLIGYNPIAYMASGDDLRDIAATACGRLLLGTDAGGRSVRDSEDTRLGYEDWVRDEFDQVVAFARGLVGADGRPAGWVTDADTAAGATRFHPPSPDGAAWVVMLQIAKDFVDGGDGSRPIVRDVLRRYAGLMPDGIAPGVTADGIMRHWYNPWTGGAAPGWDPEYATLSTMLLVAAADRARRFYGHDAEIVAAADTIIGRVRNWDAYIQPGSEALYLRAAAGGGPDFGSAGGPFYEGVMFVEQAAVYGSSDAELAHWLDRTVLPQATFVPGQPVTTNVPGGHLPAFVTLYPWIAQDPFRNDPAWRTHTRNLLASHGAWTDDNEPRFMTVFSAGTTRGDWGGYHADSLSDHPGDVTTFPSLMGFSSLGLTAPSVGAYHAYRLGARQRFSTGAEILYRRSEVDPAYTPGDAGLPDVVVGALGLAELLRPGTADAVLAVAYRPACPADLAPPAGVLNFFDVSAFLSAFSARESSADLVGPFGQHDFFDVAAYLSRFNAGCP